MLASKFGSYVKICECAHFSQIVFIWDVTNKRLLSAPAYWNKCPYLLDIHNSKTPVIIQNKLYNSNSSCNL